MQQNRYNPNNDNRAFFYFSTKDNYGVQLVKGDRNDRSSSFDNEVLIVRITIIKIAEVEHWVFNFP